MTYCLCNCHDTIEAYLTEDAALPNTSCTTTHRKLEYNARLLNWEHR